MDQHLYKYLVLHKHLCIPQLGSFVMEKESAQYDASSGTLYAPVERVRFSGTDLPVSEKIFFDFLAGEQGVDDVTAIKQFHDFSYQFRSQLQEQGSVELKGVGTLRKDESGSLVLDALPRWQDLTPPMQLSAAVDQTITVEEEETVTTGNDNWWAYAIALAILGAGILLFYYS